MKTVYEILIAKFDADDEIDFREVLKRQTQKGFEKYGKYLTINDSSIDERFVLEELVDAAAYLQALNYDDLVCKIVELFQEVNRRAKGVSRD